MTKKQQLLAKIDELKKTLADLQKQLFTGDLLPAVKRKRDDFVVLCKNNGIPIRVTSGFRSFAEQDKLYAQGRTELGNIVTNAKGGQSLHNYGVAFDVCFDSKTPYVGDWAKIGKLGESIGLEWGGRWASFTDQPHFQLMYKYTLQDFQSKLVDLTLYK